VLDLPIQRESASGLPTVWGRARRAPCAISPPRAPAPGRTWKTSSAPLLAELKADPGWVSPETLLSEVDKLERVRALGLPADLFDGATDTLISGWRARAAQEYPSDLRARPPQVRLTLLAALCWSRTSEITDTLVELFLDVVHKIGTRAERRVAGELLADLRRVRGKEGILFRLAETAVAHPEDTVRSALFPVVGEATLRDLVREAKATETRRRGAVHLFESRWKKPYSTRGGRAMLSRYAAATGLTHPISPHQLRHFLFTWLKTQGIDDALIQPYSGHESRGPG
jgi:hypothetical protein